MTRWEIINAFAKERNYESYLEVGVFRGECIDQVKIFARTGVDPDPEAPAEYHCTSDEYFNAYPEHKYDFIFIDGLHNAEQVWRDIQNALNHLNRNGVIMLHDCMPTTEKMQIPDTISHQGEEWTGDCWKAYWKALKELPYRVYLLNHDYGCGIIDTMHRERKGVYNVDMAKLDWGKYLQIGPMMNIKEAIV